MLYAKSTGGFYDIAIHGDNIPADAVEVKDEDYLALFEGQSAGKQITADAKGYPVLTDPPPPTAEELAARAKIEAQAYLNSTDWYVMRRLELGTDIPADVTQKRAEARALLNG